MSRSILPRSKPAEGRGGQHLIARRMRLSSDVGENCLDRHHEEKGWAAFAEAQAGDTNRHATTL